ncbi:hypothetical protein FGB62_7g15 [Gracilaria domingensis]|nr:hypothetical protein FGB62_7g15 [Gracilaria domingensis]
MVLAPAKHVPRPLPPLDDRDEPKRVAPRGVREQVLLGDGGGAVRIAHDGDAHVAQEARRPILVARRRRSAAQRGGGALRVRNVGAQKRDGEGARAARRCAHAACRGRTRSEGARARSRVKSSRRVTRARGAQLYTCDPFAKRLETKQTFAFHFGFELCQPSG